MAWRDEWKRIAVRLGVWQQMAHLYLDRYDFLATQDAVNQVARELVREGGDLVDRMRDLELPEPYRSEIQNAHIRLGALANAPEGPGGVMHRLCLVGALRTPIDEALNSDEAPRRSLVERAFLHLNRTLAFDDTIRAQWETAFDQETQCEKLGALHLLAHGIYAFKADAYSGRTDLILGEPVTLTEDVRSAAVMVLTEWKLVRDREDPATVAAAGLAQARRYANVELAGFELRNSRYIVLVTRKPIAAPAAVPEGDVTYRYLTVKVSKHSPSSEARASS